MFCEYHKSEETFRKNLAGVKGVHPLGCLPLWGTNRTRGKSWFEKNHRFFGMREGVTLLSFYKN